MERMGCIMIARAFMECTVWIEPSTVLSIPRMCLGPVGAARWGHAGCICVALWEMSTAHAMSLFQASGGQTVLLLRASNSQPLCHPDPEDLEEQALWAFATMGKKASQVKV